MSLFDLIGVCDNIDKNTRFYLSCNDPDCGFYMIFEISKRTLTREVIGFNILSWNACSFTIRDITVVLAEE